MISSPEGTGAEYRPTKAIVLSELSIREKEKYYQLLLSSNAKFTRYSNDRYFANLRLLSPNHNKSNTHKKRVFLSEKGSTMRSDLPLQSTEGEAVDPSVIEDIKTFKEFLAHISLTNYIQINVKTRPLRWLMKQIEDVYDARLLLECNVIDRGDFDTEYDNTLLNQTYTLSEKKALHCFPIFVLNKLASVTGVIKTLVDSLAKEILHNVNVHRKKSVAVGVFAKFLSEQYNVDDLLFFLQLRESVKKRTGRPGNFFASRTAVNPKTATTSKANGAFVPAEGGVGEAVLTYGQCVIIAKSPYSLARIGVEEKNISLLMSFMRLYASAIKNGEFSGDSHANSTICGRTATSSSASTASVIPVSVFLLKAVEHKRRSVVVITADGDSATSEAAHTKSACSAATVPVTVSSTVGSSGVVVSSTLLTSSYRSNNYNNNRTHQQLQQLQVAFPSRNAEQKEALVGAPTMLSEPSSLGQSIVATTTTTTTTAAAAVSIASESSDTQTNLPYNPSESPCYVPEIVDTQSKLPGEDISETREKLPGEDIAETRGSTVNSFSSVTHVTQSVSRSTPVTASTITECVSHAPGIVSSAEGATTGKTAVAAIYEESNRHAQASSADGIFNRVKQSGPDPDFSSANIAPSSSPVAFLPGNYNLVGNVTCSEVDDDRSTAGDANASQSPSIALVPPAAPVHITFSPHQSLLSKLFREPSENGPEFNREFIEQSPILADTASLRDYVDKSSDANSMSGSVYPCPSWLDDDDESGVHVNKEKYKSTKYTNEDVHIMATSADAPQQTFDLAKETLFSVGNEDEERASRSVSAFRDSDTGSAVVSDAREFSLDGKARAFESLQREREREYLYELCDPLITMPADLAEVLVVEIADKLHEKLSTEIEDLMKREVQICGKSSSSDWNFYEFDSVLAAILQSEEFKREMVVIREGIVRQRN